MNENNNKGNTILLTVIGVATLLIAVVGATFAYFSAQLTGTETETTIELTSGTLGMTLVGGNSILIPNPAIEDGTALYPRDEDWGTKTFTIMGNSDTAVDMPYTVSLVVDGISKFADGDLVYSLDVVSADTTADSGTTNAQVVKQPILIGGQSIAEGVFTGPTAGEVKHTYKLTLYFPENGNQNHLQEAEYKAHLEITTIAE